MNNIQRATLIEATNEAIDSCVPPLSLALQVKLREVARTTAVFGDNFATAPPCIAGQAVPYPFSEHGCSTDEHRALVAFGVSFDSVLSGRGFPISYTRFQFEVIDA